MKTRCTIFSTIVFLSVFWLSIIADPFLPSVEASRELGTVDISSVEATREDAYYHLNSSISFTINEMDTASTDDRFYHLPEIIPSQEQLYIEEELIRSFSAEANSSLIPTLPSPQEGDITSTNEANEEIISPSVEASEGITTPDLETSEKIATPNVEPSEEGTPPSSTTPEHADIAPEAIDIPVKISLYSDIAISDAKSYVNIRQRPDTNSDVVGKLYRGSAAKVLEIDGRWSYVESGSVKGYIDSTYLKTGLSDDELLENYGILRAKIKVDGLNVREHANTESKRLSVVYMNEVYPVISVQEEWLKIELTDDKVVGHIKAEFTELQVDFKKAVSREEEKELERLKKEEKAKQETAVKIRNEVDYTNDELKLLACLVHSEAGTQSYEGKLAVANVVLNRVKSHKYPSTIKAVIYQSGQFSVAHSGSLAKQLDKYDNYSSNSQALSIKAAKAAFEGENNIGSRLYFRPYTSAVKKGYDQKNGAVKLEDHLFW